MKLNSPLAMILPLFGLLMVPTLGKAQVTYGASATPGFIAGANVYILNNLIVPFALNLRSNNALSPWSVSLYNITSLENSVSLDPTKPRTSVINALVFFSNSWQSKMPATAEIDITVYPNGATTIGAEINDYFTHQLFYSSGTASDGSIKQLPATAHSFIVQ